MRILFVGSNPSHKTGKPMKAFWHDTKSMTVLKSWIKRIPSLEDGNHTVHYGNVLNIVTPNNRPLRVSEIKYGARTNLIQYINWAQPTHIIALGKAAEKALTLLGQQFYAMPHPSGLNRKLNDRKYVEEKIKGLSLYLNPSSSEIKSQN